MDSLAFKLWGGDSVARDMVRDRSNVREIGLSSMIQSGVIAARNSLFLHDEVCESHSSVAGVDDRSSRYSISERVLDDFVEAYNGRGVLRRWIRSFLFDAVIDRNVAAEILSAELHASVIAAVISSNSPDRPVKIDLDKVKFFLADQLPVVSESFADYIARRIVVELIEFLRGGGELTLDGGVLYIARGGDAVVSIDDDVPIHTQASGKGSVKGQPSSQSVVSRQKNRRPHGGGEEVGERQRRLAA